jgi:hypothetical protein
MPSLLNKDSVVLALPNAVSCVVEDEVVILHMKNGTYYGLNAVGNSVWQLIQKPKTVADIESHILQNYDVTPEQCHQDLQELLEQLSSAGLVEIDTTSSRA